MLTATVTTRGTSPYSPSFKHNVPKKPKELDDAHDERTWRHHCHVDKSGNVCIPGMAFKFALMATAAYSSQKIEGKGQQTYTKHMTAGLHIVDELIPIGHKFKDIPEDSIGANGKPNPYCIIINAHSNGKRGSGSRVNRRFPIFQDWSCKFTVYILDSTITREVFERYMTDAGRFNGMGRFRPSQGGTNGRFIVEKIVWSEEE